jgi:Immunity protein 27
MEIVDDRVRSDSTCQRIEWLTSSYLEKIASSNWETLFRDPDDGRYWEHTYPQGEMH